VFTRAEGNPFFTEQLVTAALAGAGDDQDDHSGATASPVGPGGGGGIPSGLPVRLAELLLARTARCGVDGQAVLAALAVAGRPLDEAALAEITVQDPATVRRGLRELAAARLLADPEVRPTAGGACRPRHALLAEAVADALLPGERVARHERTAAMLESADDDVLAAEAAGHWLSRRLGRTGSCPPG
jgi:predicted ATPase